MSGLAAPGSRRGFRGAAAPSPLSPAAWSFCCSGAPSFWGLAVRSCTFPGDLSGSTQFTTYSRMKNAALQCNRKVCPSKDAHPSGAHTHRKGAPIWRHPQHDLRMRAQAAVWTRAAVTRYERCRGTAATDFSAQAGRTYSAQPLVPAVRPPCPARAQRRGAHVLHTPEAPSCRLPLPDARKLLLYSPSCLSHQD